MAEIRLWAIVGEGSTGKSTVIGNLISQLGRGSGGFRHVLLRGGGYLQVYARRQSLQEAKRSPDNVIRETQKLVRDLEKKRRISVGALNLLLAIRSDSINRLPPASEYLSRFVQSGWKIESLVVLDYEGRKHHLYYDFGAALYELYDSAELLQDKSQHQWVVGQVRNHFGWVLV
jgi:hypothetical protein